MSRMPQDDRPWEAGRPPIYRGPGVEPLSTTTIILIANLVVFYLIYMSPDRRFAHQLQVFGIMQADAVLHGQVWRLFTATYMHGGLTHILFNMLGLYFLGPALERAWGPRQFFFVYTLGGVVGNVMIVLAGLTGLLGMHELALGASGSVLTLLGAATVLFPQAEIYVYFLFPVRIRTFTVAYTIWFLYNIYTRGANYGGDICHLGGLLVGLFWARRGGFSISGKHRTIASRDSFYKEIGRAIRRQPPSLPPPAKPPSNLDDLLNDPDIRPPRKQDPHDE